MEMQLTFQHDIVGGRLQQGVVEAKSRKPSSYRICD